MSVIFLGLAYRQMYRKFKKVVLGLLVHLSTLIFFSRILSSEALVYKSYFFSEEPFYGNYSTLDSLPRQDGVEKRDKVCSFYNIMAWLS